MIRDMEILTALTVALWCDRWIPLTRGQQWEPLVFSIVSLISGWTKYRIATDFRHHDANVTVMNSKIAIEVTTWMSNYITWFYGRSIQNILNNRVYIVEYHSRWWLVNSGSGNGSVSSDQELWRHMASTGRNDVRYPFSCILHVCSV